MNSRQKKRQPDQIEVMASKAKENSKLKMEMKSYFSQNTQMLESLLSAVQQKKEVVRPTYYI